MPVPRQAFHAVLLALFWPLFSGAQTVWTVSNVEGSPGDFESVEAALADARVLDGDRLELVPGAASYGTVLLDRPVDLVGLPDPSGNGHEAAVDSLTIQAGGDSEREVTIERLRIRMAVIERDLTILASCRVEEIQATGFSGLTVRQSWLDLGPGLSLNLEAAGRCRFAGNFITVDESGTVLSAGPFSEVDFHHNTIVDSEGTSEWILYRGSFRNNIIDMPAGRLALFQVETKGNVSTTESFWNEENLERIPQSDLFQLTGGEIQAYFLAEDSPAMGAGFDGEDAGFTGGYIPMVPENLPGTETAPAVPPSPELAPPFITPVTIQLDWSAAEPVDGFELQVRRVGEPYEVLQVLGSESNGLLWENLLEEKDYQIRLRTLRGGLVSPWTVSSILRTTHFPPAPVLGAPVVGTDRISVTWTVEEPVGGFDLQIREGADPYGETQSLEGGATEVEIGDLQEGTDYQFRIRSANVDANSDWTESEILTTLTTPPSPDIVPGEIGLDFLDLEWSLSEEVDSIELQIRQTGEPYEATVTFDPGSTGTRLEDLMEGTGYRIRIRSIRQGVVSPWNETGTLTTLSIPAEPVLEMAEPGLDVLVLAWSIPENVDGFELQWREGEDPYGEVLVFEPDDTETLIDDLPEGTDYQVRIRATRDGLFSPWTESLILTTLTTPPPPELVLTETGLGTVFLEWTTSETVDAWEMQFRRVSDDYTGILPFDFSTTSTQFDGLTEGTAYQARIRAIRQEIPSEWTESPPLTTLSTPPVPQLELAEAGRDSVALQWISAEAVDSFEVQIRKPGEAYGAVQSFPGETAGTVLENLDPGTDYQVRLRSIRSGISSPWKESAVFTTRQPETSLEIFRGIFGEDVQETDAWMQSNWFGWFSPAGEGLVLHLAHGYVFPAGTPDSVYFFDAGLGLWTWSSQFYYPNYYIFRETPGWYRFYEVTASPDRYFYEYATDQPLHEDEL